MREQLSLYQDFVQRWGGGCGSDSCPGPKEERDQNPRKRNIKVVFARGKVPCDVLFVGEAPGESENVLGKPFVGPAGTLLDHIVERALGSEGDRQFRVAFTNVVCCIPRAEDEHGRVGKAEAPSEEQIRCCQPRLIEFIEIASPRLVVAVGGVARDFLDGDYRHSVKLSKLDCAPAFCQIMHPAAILRRSQAQRGLDVQRCVVTIQNAVDDAFAE